MIHGNTVTLSSSWLTLNDVVGPRSVFSRSKCAKLLQDRSTIVIHTHRVGRVTCVLLTFGATYSNDELDYELSWTSLPLSSFSSLVSFFATRFSFHRGQSGWVGSIVTAWFLRFMFVTRKRWTSTAPITVMKIEMKSCPTPGVRIRKTRTQNGNKSLWPSFYVVSLLLCYWVLHVSLVSVSLLFRSVWGERLDLRERDKRWSKRQVKNSFIICILLQVADRLCGLMVRVLGNRSRGPGSIPGATRRKRRVVGLERGPLSLVSTTEELIDRKVAAFV
jgi:hypothetical protein